ncbi:MAG: ribokinase [Nocardioidaceae bacterium]
MNRSAPGRVCVVGSLNVDTTLRVPVLPGPGQTTLASGRSVAAGGKGANQAVAARWQGSEVTLVAAVGDDREGRASLSDLQARGIDVSAVQVLPDTPTGAAVVLVADDGENVIIVDPSANAALEPGWVRHQVTLARPDVVVAQLEVPLSCVRAAAEVSTAKHFILNPAPMPSIRAELDGLLALVDVLVPNRPELAQLVAADLPVTLDDVDRCARRLAFAGTLVVTLGREGVAVYGDQGRRRVAHVAAAVVEVLDTTGAGDAFCGVLADQLARGVTMVDAVEQATRVAGLSTTVRGAQLPSSLDPLDQR